MEDPNPENPDDGCSALRWWSKGVFLRRGALSWLYPFGWSSGSRGEGAAVATTPAARSTTAQVRALVIFFVLGVGALVGADAIMWHRPLGRIIYTVGGGVAWAGWFAVIYSRIGALRSKNFILRRAGQPPVRSGVNRAADRSSAPILAA